MRRGRALLLALLLVPAIPSAEAETLDLSDRVTLFAAAVGEVDGRFVGSTATITVTSAQGGRGHIFLDTFPLAEVDMQGSARLAVRVAGAVTGEPLRDRDFFFVVRSGSTQIGGPSAGATLAVGAIAAMKGWRVRDDVLMTGTITPDGSVGPVGGIPEKAEAAAKMGLSRFLYPAGQESASRSGSGQPVEMAAHCRSLGIECLPVIDVVDAVGLMTDHALERRPVTGNVTGEAFLAKLAPLARALVDAASTLTTEARQGFDGLDATERAALGGRMASAERLLESARSAATNGTPYTAASLSFQTSIEARYVRETARVASAADGAAALDASLREADRVVRDAARRVEAERVATTTDFEPVGAAQDRILEAEGLLAQAAAATDAATALYQAAYAAERAHTATWWLSLREGLPAGEPLEAAGLGQAARDIVQTSTEELAYVKAVFASAGIPADLRVAEEHLAHAEAALTRGFHPAAMYLAVEASVRAAVLLELAGYGGTIPATKLDAARTGAARAIEAARGRGEEPLIAQSQYEFGTSLDNDLDQLIFLGLARVSANLAGLPILFDQRTPAPSRFQEIPDPTPRVPATWLLALFALGLTVGVGAGLVALMPRDEKKDEGNEADARAPPW